MYIYFLVILLELTEATRTLEVALSKRTKANRPSRWPSMWLVGYGARSRRALYASITRVTSVAFFASP